MVTNWIGSIWNFTFFTFHSDPITSYYDEADSIKLYAFDDNGPGEVELELLLYQPFEASCSSAPVF